MKKKQPSPIFVIAVLLCALWALPGLAEEQAQTFTDFGSGTTIELVSGRGLWQINWGQGPWTWFDQVGDSLLDAHVSGLLDIHTTAPADISADRVATLPIAGTLTLSANDPQNSDNLIGAMVLSGTGVNVIDIHADRVMVDEGSGMMLAPFPAPNPNMTLTLETATGVFAAINQISDWQLEFAGSYAAPLIEGLPLQNNIYAALGGNVALIGGLGAFALTGQYVPDMSKQAESFCAYGRAHATSLAPSAGVWAQTWDQEPHDWFTCQVPASGNVLANDVVGHLETHATAGPQIDEDYILSLPLAGILTLTDYNDSDPNQIDGQIIADIETVFVADLNAERATIDPNGNVITAFGAAVQQAATAVKVTVTAITGSYANIQPIGNWNFYVNGTFTAAVLPDIPLQQSILSALQTPELLLSAEEEIVLTGWYTRSEP